MAQQNPFDPKTLINSVIAAPTPNYLTRKFYLTKLLGEGGEGFVLAATPKDCNLKQDVAMKFQTKRNQAENSFIKDLMDYQRQYDSEPRTSSGIISIIESFQYENYQILLMELGTQDLYTYIKSKHNLSIKNRYLICLQLLRPIYYLHSKNLFHRDIKPENFIQVGEQFKLIDFGLVKTADNDSLKTKGVGSLFYQAPELIEKSNKYDCKVDIWALACVIYEILSGESFFANNSQQDFLNQITQYKSQKELFQKKIDLLKIPIDCQATIKKMFDPDSSQRPSILAIIEIFENYRHLDFDQQRNYNQNQQSQVNQLNSYQQTNQVQQNQMNQNSILQTQMNQNSILQTQIQLQQQNQQVLQTIQPQQQNYQVLQTQNQQQQQNYQVLQTQNQQQQQNQQVLQTQIKQQQQQQHQQLLQTQMSTYQQQPRVQNQFQQFQNQQIAPQKLQMTSFDMDQLCQKIIDALQKKNHNDNSSKNQDMEEEPYQNEGAFQEAEKVMVGTLQKLKKDVKFQNDQINNSLIEKEKNLKIQLEQNKAELEAKNNQLIEKDKQAEYAKIEIKHLNEKIQNLQDENEKLQNENQELKYNIEQCKVQKKFKQILEEMINRYKDYRNQKDQDQEQFEIDQILVQFAESLQKDYNLC